jgi:hypothetical protein
MSGLGRSVAFAFVVLAGVTAGAGEPPAPSAAARRRAFLESEAREYARQLGKHPFWACKWTEAEMMGILDRLYNMGPADERGGRCAFVSDEGGVYPATKEDKDKPVPGQAFITVFAWDKKLKLKRVDELRQALDAAHAIRSEKK